MAVIVLAVLSAGCAGVTVQPGHRGLYFAPSYGGVQHEVLQPGWYQTPCPFWRAREQCPHVIDYAVTFATSTDEVHTVSDDGTALDITVALVYRPIIAELYFLDTELGPHYFEELVHPEFQSAAVSVFSHTRYHDLERHVDTVAGEVERQLRDRLRGKHVEISAVLVRDVRVADRTPAPCNEQPAPKAGPT